MKFVRYKSMWWELIDDTILEHAVIQNSFVASKPRIIDVNIAALQQVEVESPNDLNFEGTPLQNPTAPTGWLNPQGQFFGCDDRYHSAHARFVQHKKDESDLESLGWLKITYFQEGRPEPFYKGHPESGIFPSMAQIAWLESHLYCDITELKEARRLGLHFQHVKNQEQTPDHMFEEEKTK